MESARGGEGEREKVVRVSREIKSKQEVEERYFRGQTIIEERNESANNRVRRE